jgi:hypothetical protein
VFVYAAGPTKNLAAFFAELFDEVEGALPACLIEEVQEDVAHEAETLADGLFVDLVGGGFEGPVDEHGAAYDVFARDKAPETAVEAFGAVVAHGKDLAWGDDEIFALDVAGQFVGPGRGDAVVGTGRNGGKVIAVGVEGVLRISVVYGLAGLRLILRDSVEVDDAVAEMDVVAGDADGAFDEEEVRGLGVRLEEDDNVAAADVAVVDERGPLRGRSEGDAVYQNVVANEQRLLHGGGGDLEVLEDEGHDEEADREHSADGGEGLEWRLGLVLLFGVRDVWYGFRRIGQN